MNYDIVNFLNHKFRQPLSHRKHSEAYEKPTTIVMSGLPTMESLITDMAGLAINIDTTYQFLFGFSICQPEDQFISRDRNTPAITCPRSVRRKTVLAVDTRTSAISHNRG
jgi:hypothetical protein